jgi:Cupin domain
MEHPGPDLLSQSNLRFRLRLRGEHRARAVRAGSCSSNAGRVHPDAGILDLKLDGVWVQAKVGDLVRLPRGIPHGYFNKSNKPARAFFWVSPTRKLEALFDKLHGLTDPAEVVAISSQHEVDFMPPEAND